MISAYCFMQNHYLTCIDLTNLFLLNSTYDTFINTIHFKKRPEELYISRLIYYSI